MCRRSCLTVIVAILALMIALTAIFVTAASAQSTEDTVSICWVRHDAVALLVNNQARIGLYIDREGHLLMMDFARLRYAEWVAESQGCLGWEGSYWGLFPLGLFAFGGDIRGKSLKHVSKHRSVYPKQPLRMKEKADPLFWIFWGLVLVFAYVIMTILVNQPI
jgi:hypothetical protein